MSKILTLAGAASCLLGAAGFVSVFKDLETNGITTLIVVGALLVVAGLLTEKIKPDPD